MFESPDHRILEKQHLLYNAYMLLEDKKKVIDMVYAMQFPKEREETILAAFEITDDDVKAFKVATNGVLQYEGKPAVNIYVKKTKKHGAVLLRVSPTLDIETVKEFMKVINAE